MNQAINDDIDLKNGDSGWPKRCTHGGPTYWSGIEAIRSVRGGHAHFLAKKDPKNKK